MIVLSCCICELTIVDILVDPLKGCDGVMLYPEAIVMICRTMRSLRLGSISFTLILVNLRIRLERVVMLRYDLDRDRLPHSFESSCFSKLKLNQ